MRATDSKAASISIKQPGIGSAIRADYQSICGARDEKIFALTLLGDNSLRIITTGKSQRPGMAPRKRRPAPPGAGAD
ncbi:MAG: hypothetical protein KA137_03260 [Halioglobus sp.]|nr:hypothetical protein [Halioglobus sp.]